MTLFKSLRTILQTEKGFTLMEMLIVVTIIGILAAIIMPRFTKSSDEARRKAHQTDRQHMNAQIELFYFQSGKYPTSFDKAQWSADVYDNGVKTKIDWDDFFPDGMPSKCNKNIDWKIDAAVNRVALGDHTSCE